MFRNKVFSNINSEEKINGETNYSVKIASYDSLVSLPKVDTISSNDLTQLIGKVAEKTYNLAHMKGSNIPFIVINEIVENLIHANFQDAVISIMPDGNTIRVSDHGPGIKDKDKALLPGFSTATQKMQDFIRGVGSGLPIANESLSIIGGNLEVVDNIDKKGAVITLSLSHKNSKKDYGIEQKQDKKMKTTRSEPVKKNTIPFDISPRQKKVFLLIAEAGEAGPSTVSEDLNASLSTAYRDLVALEEEGLVECIDGGKRKLTRKGVEYLSEIM